jgi:hypothetical protein
VHDAPEEPTALAWRVRQLELVEQALRIELRDLRKEYQASLRRDYLTAAEMRNLFITREELGRQAAVRREWWPIVFAGVCGLTTIANLVSTIGGH